MLQKETNGTTKRVKDKNRVECIEGGCAINEAGSKQAGKPRTEVMTERTEVKEGRKERRREGSQGMNERSQGRQAGRKRRKA